MRDYFGVNFLAKKSIVEISLYKYLSFVDERLLKLPIALSTPTLVKSTVFWIENKLIFG